MLMKKTFIVLATILALSSHVSYAQNVEDFITFGQVDPLSRIFKESNYFPEFSETIEVAKGECATFQFAVRSALPLKNLQFSVSSFSDGNGAKLDASRVGFIDYVRENRLTPDLSKDAVRPLSNYYPDPIREVQNWSVGRDQAQPMWITLPIPVNAKEGNYKAEVKLSGVAGGTPFTFKKDIFVKVYPVTLERPSLWVSNWFSVSDEKMKIFNSGEPVKRYSPDYWNMVTELAEKLGECYTNVILASPLELVDFKEKAGKYSFDYTNFDRFIEIFKQEGVLDMIEGGHIAGRKGDWASSFELYVPEYDKDGAKKNVQYPLDSEKVQNFYGQFLPSLKKHLEAKGLDKLYVQHIADEPIEENYQSYVAIAQFVKKVWPGVKIMEACHTHNLENTVDIWIPQLNFYQSGYKFYTERQKAGDEVWFYTCLAPQGNYVNRFLELPLMKTRLVHWLNFRFGATGYLHWGFNQWKGDPYGETTFMNLESGNTLPGGDSWIVYPDKGKLYSSIRMEAMRDGITDYTLLKMFEKKNPELAKELCRQVVFNWALYDMDTDHFRMIRHQILEELSK